MGFEDIKLFACKKYISNDKDKNCDKNYLFSEYIYEFVNIVKIVVGCYKNQLYLFEPLLEKDSNSVESKRFLIVKDFFSKSPSCRIDKDVRKYIKEKDVDLDEIESMIFESISNYINNKTKNYL